ncbi:MAG: EF-hand domain-containing protein [Gammaproteobacteria bacterium]|jgi:Ca2+-binding EF-hand superfamily protein
MTDNTCQEDLQDLQGIFNRYDRDKNGTIDWDEFCLLVDELIGDMPLDEKSLAFHLVDRNHTGMITFQEFVDWWRGHD